ncbi:pentatricopeptide repeat-containing protein At4g18520, chloroplastic-like [Selaginella moellendorffii]|uniref:pentatricopeptide repeat-containing protein At4g18520, chloroplastic-like n=1 Tax=Selaginella moellendorffii TaxID=88036 RepID=UPI000D1C57BB|nr:pentatricopeptide repeat-containing protein At4g18520, chloroplastic-like [Selaginella moellendorffii]|eukprot:XP_024539421.1 pentatricopeptide repeat-containing protein At4g18520, chloroplastic-like [Selaginella moellendorffii]
MHCRRFGSLKDPRAKISKLLAALKESTRARDLERGKIIHAEAAETGEELNTFVASSLINMYAKCGSMEDARKVFDKSSPQDVFLWTALLSGYVESGEAEIALGLFSRMKASRCEPSGHTYAAVLKACSSVASKEVGSQVEGRVVKLAALRQGMGVHREAAKRGCVDMVVANMLVDTYARCGSLWDSRGVFDQMRYHDVVSWTSLVWGYAQHEEFEVALELFSCMMTTRCVPNARSFVVALKACSGMAVNKDSKQETLETGRAIHSHATKLGLDSEVAVRSCLIEMYFQCGSVEDARKVFESTQNHDVASWNTMLLGYARDGEEEAAFQLFERMKSTGIHPNSQTYLAALRACTNVIAREEAKQGDLKVVALAKGIEIHSGAEKNGLVSDKLVASSLIDMYAKCGEMREARRTFDRLQQRDVVVWTTLILGYTQNGQPQLALHLYEQMLETGGCVPDSQCFVAALKACILLATKNEQSSKALSLEKGSFIGSQAAKAGCESDAFVGAALVDLYTRCGSMDNARHVFDKLHSPGAVSWTSMIAGYAQKGQCEVAIQEFYRMQLEGCLPVTQTYIAALKACSGQAVKEESRREDGRLLKVQSLKRTRVVHSQATATGFGLDAYVASTLVDSYSKCGSMFDAHRVCASTEDSVVAWTALVLGYVQNSDSEAALEAFAEMRSRGCQPDSQLLGAVLKACSDVAAVEGGREVHALVLRRGFESNAEITNALVDLYGKSGLMLEAQHLFDSIPACKSIETWTTLMGGYSRLGDANRVFDLLHAIQESGVKPDGITFTYVLAACSHAGLVRQGTDYFRLMVSKYRVEAELEHYHGMIDLLGRANRLEEAVEVVRSMRLQPTAVTWMTLLSSCKKWKNVCIAELAFGSLLELDQRHAAAHVLMGNIYASVGMWEKKHKILHSGLAQDG